MAENIPNLIKQKFTNPRSSTKLKQKKQKQNYTKAFHNQINVT